MTQSLNGIIIILCEIPLTALTVWLSYRAGVAAGFLLLGLGMASGLGSFAVAGLGAVFLCVCLVLLDFVGERKQRTMMLEMVASGSEFPAEYVNRLLAAYQIRCEPREVDSGKKATVRYLCHLDPNTPLQRLSEQLMDPAASGLKSVVWESPKRE
jgi:hypothetical protein